MKSKFGSKKEDIVIQTKKNRAVYEKYKAEIQSNPPKIISLDDLARTLGISIFDPNKILPEFKKDKISNKKYNQLTDTIVNTIFHGSLIFKEKINTDTIFANSYYINNFQKFFNVLRQRFKTDELVIIKVNANLSQDISNEIKKSFDNDKFKIVFCTTNSLNIVLKNSLIITNHDLIEIIHDYKEGDLFEDNGFLFKNIK